MPIHLLGGDGRTLCCGRAAGDLPLSDGVTADEAKVTCPNPGTVEWLDEEWDADYLRRLNPPPSRSCVSWTPA